MPGPCSRHGPSWLPAASRHHPAPTVGSASAHPLPCPRRVPPRVPWHAPWGWSHRCHRQGLHPAPSCWRWGEGRGGWILEEERAPCPSQTPHCDCLAPRPPETQRGWPGTRGGSAGTAGPSTRGPSVGWGAEPWGHWDHLPQPPHPKRKHPPLPLLPPCSQPKLCLILGSPQPHLPLVHGTAPIPMG